MMVSSLNVGLKGEIIAISSCKSDGHVKIFDEGPLSGEGSLVCHAYCRLLSQFRVYQSHSHESLAVELSLPILGQSLSGFKHHSLRKWDKHSTTGSKRGWQNKVEKWNAFTTPPLPDQFSFWNDTITGAKYLKGVLAP